jgi:homoserine O-acetyltransferase/O-succinyltransferase
MTISSWYWNVRTALLIVLLGSAWGCRRPSQAASAGAAAFDRSLLRPNDTTFVAAAPDSFLAHFQTSRGDFIVRVVRAWAPRGVDRFYNLARTGFFDRQKFFRVRANFIAQFGLHPDPQVIAAWKNERMPDDSARVSNTRGTLAYAMLTTPNTRTTQIYINLADNTRLDAEGFAPFGRIVQGIDVIDRLYAVYDERAGGGVRAGNQGPIEREGNAWLERNFPLLDHIVSVKLVR